MSTQLVKAAKIVAPNDVNGTANDFGVRKFTIPTSHAANAVPDAWRGRWVSITAVGSDCHYGFSIISTAEVDSSVAASAAGASNKVGGLIPSGETRDVLIPSVDSARSVYFVRETSDAAAGVAYMQLTDREDSP